MTKRVFDLLVAGIGLAVLSPAFLVAAVLIKLDSPGPVFYKGARIGKDGILFSMYKFRTMVVNADSLGPALTHEGDPRITKVGRILRKWKIDELPQLINVVLGEMSLVGPRPESPGYVEHYTEEQRSVLSVRPGITGPAQIRFRNEEAILGQFKDRERVYITTIMPHKLTLDLEYVAHASLLSDLKLVAMTFLALVKTDEFANRERTDEHRFRQTDGSVDDTLAGVRR